MGYDNLIDSVRKQKNSKSINKVIVALSGGADSIATAFALKKVGVELLALHCNFHLRGEESNRDMNFVMDFCHENQIQLEIKEFDVNEYVTQNPHESVEMACRNLRHEWFREKLAATGYDRIATGHNADDNIETLFLNLLRGSGTRGVKGMTEDTGIIWRPLLRFHRDEIISFINRSNLSYIIDSTNLESDFRRNFLRNKVFPLIKTQWKGFDKAMDSSISHLEEENQVVEYLLNKTIGKKKKFLKRELILNFPAPLLLIRRFIEQIGPYTTTAFEVYEALIANKPHIRTWNLRLGNLTLRNGILSINNG